MASNTDGFSFAYLKEALCVNLSQGSSAIDTDVHLHYRRSVSTLVLMAGFEDDEKAEFRDVLKGQIKSLRDQLDKNKDKVHSVSPTVTSGGAMPARGSPASRSMGGAPKIDERSIGLARIWDTMPGGTGGMPGALPSGPGQQAGPSAKRELRSMAYSLGRSFMP